MTLHFGIGAATSVDLIEVKWPDGTLETFKSMGIDQVFKLVEGKGVIKKSAH